MAKEKTSHTGAMHTLVDSTDAVESVAVVGTGCREVLKEAGVWDLVKQLLQHNGVQTGAALAVGGMAIHFLPLIIALLVYRNEKKKRAESAEEKAKVEAEERADRERIENYLKALTASDLKDDEKHAREQIRYLVGETAKKEDVWEVSRKLDRLLDLNAAQLRQIGEKGQDAPSFMAFLGDVPTLLDRIEGMHDDVRVIGRNVEKILVAVEKPAPAPTRRWSIPLPSAYFTGQEEYLERLAAILDAGETGGITQPAGLRGFGGIGKTELALAYAQKYSKEYNVGHFIVSDSLASLDNGLARIAAPDLSTSATLDQIQRLKRQALYELGQSERSLVVFDNVDDIVGGMEFQGMLAALPRAHVLVTCRHREMGDHIKEVPVLKMDEGTGALYILRLGLGNDVSGPWRWEEFNDIDRANAQSIAKELDGLPLALHHAGSAIRGEQISVGELLKDYLSNRNRILSNRGKGAVATHPDSAQVTVVRAFERLQAQCPAAAQLIICCAFLDPDAISEDIFTGNMIMIPNILADEMERFSEIRSNALASSLIERNPEEKRLNIHRVTQVVLQDRIGTSASSYLREVTDRAIIALYEAGRDWEAMQHLRFRDVERSRIFGLRHSDNIESANDFAEIHLSTEKRAEHHGL